MSRVLNFYRTESQRWFVNLPEYEGPVEDLEMVAGADTLLDIISMNHFDGENLVTVRVFTNTLDSNPDRAHYMLTLGEILKSEIGGATYNLYHPAISPFEIWLCDVTRFVFGEFPNTIWFEA